MYDLHCHLLPGIDDGPQNLDEALALARHAVANGITHAVTTPHVHPGRYNNTHQSIQKLLKQFQVMLQEAAIPLTLRAAGEVRISPEIIPMLQQNQIPFLGTYENQSVLLLELPHSHIPPGSDKLVDFLIKQNIRPMIAHPERNKDVMRNLKKLEPFIDRGCLMQLTAASVAGDFGSSCQDTASAIIQNHWATILASDAHNLSHRPPELKPGFNAVAKLLNTDAASAMIIDRPKAISAELFAHD
ncbi:MAG: capsular biosynthesis protein [Gammaproteobacteria bacterium]|nr:capsular biosynthesis protein [Gammaproteobacteria bacterium]